jgi:hypothetical protein
MRAISTSFLFVKIAAFDRGHEARKHRMNEQIRVLRFRLDVRQESALIEGHQDAASARALASAYSTAFSNESKW